MILDWIRKDFLAKHNSSKETMVGNTQRQCGLLLLLLCISRCCSQANIPHLQIESTKRTGERMLKSTKTSKGSNTPSAARQPLNEPTPSPTSSTLLASGNIFDFSDQKDKVQTSGKQDVSSATSSSMSRHVIIKISVAVPHNVRPQDVIEKVAKVTTKVIRSYTPFLVYMLDGSRRNLQTTDLEYDTKFSSVALLYHGPQVSWWTYNVAYKVTKQPEEVEEASAIDDLATAAVEDAIQSGLFLQLLTPMAPTIHGVAVPGHELDQDIDAPKGTQGAKQSPEKDTRKRLVGIGLGILCAGILLLIVFAFTLSERKRRRVARHAWSISMEEQKERGQILNSEWDNAYYGEAEAPAGFKGAFTLGPRDPEGSYMFSEWEYGTSTGTEEVTFRGSSTVSQENVFLT